MSAEQEKSEQATPYKLREARKKGQVNKSVEVTSLFMVLSLLVIVSFWIEGLASGVSSIAKSLFMFSGEFNLTQETIGILLWQVLTDAAVLIAPVYVLLVFVAIISNMMQTGVVFSSHPITPDFKKLNPISGLKKLFSIKTVFELAKTLLKIGVIYAIWLVFGDLAKAQLLAVHDMDMGALLAHWQWLSTVLILSASAVMAPIVLVDFLFSKWNFAKQMRMSKQEVKDEHKKREGDPQVKQKQKQIQKELLQKAASLKSVKDADAIITNPQHIAVALKYDPKEMLAPKILAMGKNNNAAVIRKIARQHRVPVFRNVMLARKLFKNSISGGYIPESCYIEVAAIFRQLLNAGAQGQEPA